MLLLSSHCLTRPPPPPPRLPACGLFVSAAAGAQLRAHRLHLGDRCPGENLPRGTAPAAAVPWQWRGSRRRWRRQLIHPADSLHPVFLLLSFALPVHKYLPCTCP